MLTGVSLPWITATAGLAQYMHSTFLMTHRPFSKEFFQWYGKMLGKSR
jgi:hypothetical protein